MPCCSAEAILWTSFFDSTKETTRRPTAYVPMDRHPFHLSMLALRTHSSCPTDLAADVVAKVSPDCFCDEAWLTSAASRKAVRVFFLGECPVHPEQDLK